MDTVLILVDDALNFHGYLIAGKRLRIWVGQVDGLVSSSWFVDASTVLQTVLHEKKD